MKQAPQTLGAMLQAVLDGAKQPKQVRIDYSRLVRMPSVVHELTRDFAGTMHLDHDVFMQMLWTKLGNDLNAAMNAVVDARRAARECFEVEERCAQAQERSHALHDAARELVDSVCGTDNPLVL